MGCFIMEDYANQKAFYARSDRKLGMPTSKPIITVDRPYTNPELDDFNARYRPVKRSEIYSAVGKGIVYGLGAAALVLGIGAGIWAVNKHVSGLDAIMQREDNAKIVRNVTEPIYDPMQYSNSVPNTLEPRIQSEIVIPAKK